MSYEELASLVRKMRAAQVRYFKTKDRDVLRDAQRLEREVDAAVTEPTLFGREP